MWTVFADDSEVCGAKNLHRGGLNHLVAMAAVVFTDDGVRDYTAAIAGLRRQLGVPAGCELKWSPPSGSWLKTSEGNAVRHRLREGMLAAAIGCGARSVSVVYDRIGSQPVQVVKERVLRYLYDKVNLALWAGGGTAVMIADEPGGAGRERSRWLADCRQLAACGTAYTTTSRLPLPIMTSPSEHLEPLQLADLVAGATTAAVAGNRHALALTRSLARLAERNRAGRIGGAGVTIWPPRHVDLYWWLFGEDVYQRRGHRLRLGPAADGSRAGWRTFQAGPGTGADDAS